MANTDAKDAAYHNENNLTLPEEGTTITIPLQRPLAKYRIIADDVETYRKLAEAEPEKYPPLEELTVTVEYEDYFPAKFNVADEMVTGVTTYVAYSIGVTYAEMEEQTLCSDWITAIGESSVTATLTVTDGKGNEICRVSGVRIAYKPGCMTTIRGKFLTAGINAGGITMDTDWEDIIIRF